MRLETLTIKGLLAFREPMTLDLRDVPPGLIAIVGAIGQGKTTILESSPAGLFRELPTRKKPIFDYALGSDAFIEQTFALDGQGVYRARLNLDGPRRKADAVLLHVEADGTTRALSDGKLPSYDAAVQAILPPLPSWLASVFSSQNRAGSFANIPKAERKTLFASFLGLDQLEAWAERAKLAAAQVQIVIDRLVAQRDLLARDAGADVEAQLHADAGRLQTDGAAIELRRADLQRDLDALETDLAGLQVAAAAHATARATLDRVLVDLQSTAGERTSALTALERLASDAAAEQGRLTTALEGALAVITRKMADLSGRDAAYARIETERKAQIADLEERLTNNRAILADADAIRAAARDFERCEADLATARTEERAALEDLQTARGRVQAVDARLTTLAGLDEALGRARQSASLLTRVPFGDACAPCQFMTTAAAAKAEIPALEEACGDRAAIEADRDTAMTAVRTLERHTAGLHQRIVSLEQQRDGLRQQAGRLGKLEQAEHRITDLEARRAQIETGAERQAADVAAREQARQADLVDAKAQRDREHTQQVEALAQRTQARRTELEARVDQLAQRETALTFERDNLRDQVAATTDASERAAAQSALQVLRRREWDASTETWTRLQHERAELERRREAFAARRRELQGTEREIARLTDDVLEWQLLAQALGRDGLQTLEIDAAGPTVSAFCNDLLRSCGLPFTVDLVTQEAKVSKAKDGSTHKEVFELKVYDTERGGAARDLADLSGGQQVLVDEALKSAIALLVNQRNVQPIRTCWRDETTGSLDPDTAQRYIEMLRRVHQIGGFNHLFFITHNPEAALQADAQIVVDGGRADVRLPPYSAEVAA